jgi:hypothetical protein
MIRVFVPVIIINFVITLLSHLIVGIGRLVFRAQLVLIIVSVGGVLFLL